MKNIKHKEKMGLLMLLLAFAGLAGVFGLFAAIGVGLKAYRDARNGESPKWNLIIMVAIFIASIIAIFAGSGMIAELIFSPGCLMLCSPGKEIRQLEEFFSAIAVITALVISIIFSVVIFILTLRAKKPRKTFDNWIKPYGENESTEKPKKMS